MQASTGIALNSNDQGQQAPECRRHEHGSIRATAVGMYRGTTRMTRR
jgi:hypothetical protein